ncbi:hypothetical protein CQW23_29822 [Capsicum baccatum]|uniref:Calmodulin-binding domain-containing protein n=1 Tax=Capsicum baccatum TaxID=33114 RepID=A0A2G2VC13_CAPBA|nr:hypothetical protein CQW23_29822 [Capsicum baccatum]
MKNDSAGSKLDKINTIKPRSMSNGNKVLPYYPSSSSTSSYNAGNTRRQSTGNLNAPDTGQDVIHHYGVCWERRRRGPWSFKRPPLLQGVTRVMQRRGFWSSKSFPLLLSDTKKGILVKQKLSTPPVNMLEEGKKVNEVYQKPSSPQESVLKDREEATMVEQKPSSPPGCMEGGIDEVTMVEQKSSASLGKKLNVVDRRPSPKVHSLEPSEIKKKKILRRDGTNKLNLEMVPDKTLRTPKVKASPKYSSHLQSRPLSNEKDKREVVKSADSALGKYTSSSKKLLHIAEAETVGKNQKKTLRKGKTGYSNDNNSSAVKLKFRKGKIVDLQQETSSPRRMTFRWGRHVGESQDNNITKRIFKNKRVDGDKINTIPISGKIVLRHKDVQEKKDVQGLLNNVIEKTESKLVEIGKNKVKALVGAFETVISLHSKPSAVSFLIN